jgi:hypothetical protein
MEGIFTPRSGPGIFITSDASIVYIACLALPNPRPGYYAAASGSWWLKYATV